MYIFNKINNYLTLIIKNELKFGSRFLQLLTIKFEFVV